MIDLHSHVLPGIDDGSRDLQMTRQMLEEMARQGVQTVVATPHFYATSDKPEAFFRRRATALEKVSELQGDLPGIIPGAEVAYFDGMSRSDVLSQLQLGTSSLVLVEMPFCRWTKRMIREVCEINLETGLTPVLAHVNRYCSQGQLLKFQEQLLDEGVLFQCNAEAFINPFSRSWALKQVRQRNIHFLGSDAHNMTARPPKLQQAAQIIQKKLGAETLDRLTLFTAARLYNKPLK